MKKKGTLRLKKSNRLRVVSFEPSQAQNQRVNNINILIEDFTNLSHISR